MVKESKYIKRCASLIEKKLNWGSYNTWTNHNYDLLSDQISEMTGISISPRTLRRIFSNKMGYNPQNATKDALARYMDYANWEDFCANNKRNGSEQSAMESEPKPNYYKRIVTNPYLWGIISLLLVFIIIFIIVFYPSVETEMNKRRVEFSSNNTIGRAPHTASFYYDVSRVTSSNIFIDNNYYDNGELIPVKKNMNHYSKVFELPDYYAVKIIANGERMKCVGVHVVTDGWETIINHQLEPTLDPVNEGLLHVDPSVLAARNITDTGNFVTEYRNIKDFGIMGDNLTLEVKFKNNTRTGGKPCFDSRFEVINLHGRLAFNFVDPNCDNKQLTASFGEVSLNSDFNNLNTFLQDVSYWRILEIKTQNKRVGVYLDKVQVYSIIYKDPLDDVKGLAISFRGSGAVDYVKMYNEEGELVYNDEFER